MFRRDESTRDTRGHHEDPNTEAGGRVAPDEG